MNLTRMLDIASAWKPLVAIRTGYATLLPLILLQGIAISAAAAVGLVLEEGQGLPIRNLLNYTHTFVLSLLPMLSVATISYHAANLYGGNRPYAVVLSIFVFLLLILTLDKNAGHRVDEVTLTGNFYSLIVGPMVPWALSRLEGISMLHLFKSPQQNAYIRRFLNYVLPTLIIVAAAVAMNYVILASQNVFSPSSWHASNSDWADHLPGLMLYAAVLNGLWTIGIHGTLALSPWVLDLRQNLEENAAAAMAGDAIPHVFPASSFHAFVHLGGSGAAMALAIAVFVLSRSRTKRLICASAFPVLCFNVNELVIFGLPVIFNRHLMPPFVLAPLMSTLVAYVAIANGIVPVPTESPGWTTPPLLGAWLATNGSWAAVGLALFNLCMSTAIYMPFVRRWESMQRAAGASVLEFKDRFRFDNEHLTANIEQDDIDAMDETDDALRDALILVREGTMCAYYQPIVAARTGRIVGVESLLRLKHPERGILPPTFIEPLKKANLSSEIDAWVIANLVADWRSWNTERYPLPDIHINVHPNSLLSTHLVERLIEAGRLLPLVVEIIEDELPADIERLLMSIEMLRRNGIRLAIDDFGVGYSSLSRLAQIGISLLKIDKSMLDAVSERPEGGLLLASVIEFVKKLGNTVCVEGVERPEQLKFLQNCGVDHIQGYLASRPLPWDAMCALLQSGEPIPAVLEAGQTALNT